MFSCCSTRIYLVIVTILVYQAQSIFANETLLKPQSQAAIGAEQPDNIITKSFDSREHIEKGSPIQHSDSVQNVDKTTEPTSSHLVARPAAGTNSNAPQRRLVRSRYKLRPRGVQFNQAAYNYSQPYDTQSSSDNQQQLATGRALLNNAYSADLYVPSTRAQVSAASPIGQYQESAANEQANQMPAYQPDAQIYPPTDYNPMGRLHSYAPSAVASRSYSTIGSPSPSRMRGELANYSPYLGSQQINSLNYAEPHYQPNTAYTPDYDPYLTSASYNNASLGENIASYSIPSGFANLPPIDLSHADMFANHLSGRNRWSWPWFDVSSYGHNLGNAASFKKFAHHHHHHSNPHHKEEFAMHHHEGDHLAAKWEHGITLGEIACIAVAVVLGIVILGSPFFLLYLMLFNGGNMMGANQMSLLAPAIPGAGAATAAGRRRKRSIEAQNSNLRRSKSAQATSLQDAIGDYLLEHLSPFMDPEKVLQSFHRLASVKDDVDRIVAKLSQPDKMPGHEHTEMRRRKR